MQERQPQTFEIHAVIKGTWNQFRVYPSKEGISVYFQDITERKKAEEALRESEERYRMLHENMRDAFAQVSMNGRIVEFNDLYCKMLGYSPEEMLKLTYQELTPERWHTIEDNIIREQVIPRGYSDVYEKEYRRKDGVIIPLELRTILSRDASGRPNGMWAIVRDISERKKAEEDLKKAYSSLEEKVKERTAKLEEAYNSLLENERRLNEAQEIAHIGSWDWDIVNEKTYWSDESYRIGRTTPQEFGLPHNEYFSCIHPCDQSYVENAVKEALNGKTLSIDYRMILTDGEERIVHVQAEVIFDENNNPVRMRGIVQDITERKRAEETLTKMEQIRRKEIHHRIKNNLQVISSLLDLQAEKFSDRKYIKDSEVLEAFKESQDRVASIALIHEELYEGGETDTLNFSLYLKRLAENLLNTYMLGNPDIILSLDIKKDVFFDMDTAVPLGMIINELITNSLKYAFPGREIGEIRVKLMSEETGNGPGNKEELPEKGIKYSMSVSDNGVGIPKNIDFENSDTLGLQLVTTLVDQLEGKIELNRSNGTEFIILFGLEGEGNQ